MLFVVNWLLGIARRFFDPTKFSPTSGTDEALQVVRL